MSIIDYFHDLKVLILLNFIVLIIIIIIIIIHYFFRLHIHSKIIINITANPVVLILNLNDSKSNKTLSLINSVNYAYF